MKKIRQNVLRFLEKYRMDHLDIDFDSNIEAFLKDMEKGLAGRKSTLKMIPTYLEADADFPVNKRVVVADAGGTNFRVATAYFDEDKKPVIENLRLFPMPGTQGETGKDEFFGIMAGYLKDAVAAAEDIGFCFSYPVEILPNKDGRLIHFTKEVKAKDVEGRLIGENLNTALAATGLKGNKNIVLLNDTVATLLAGCCHKNTPGLPGYGSYIGLILGTGTNCCYVEKNSNIKKAKDLDPSKSQIINAESGGFGRLKQGKIDIDFDKTSANPGEQKLEKMISGAYLGPLCLRTIHRACTENMFSAPAAEGLWQMSELETKDMNAFLLCPYGDSPLAKACKNDTDDTLTLYYIADRLTERAAKLTAINLSAMAIKSGKRTDPTRPICIVAEGTTFHQMKGLKPRIEFYLRKHLENKLGIYFDIISVENATLIGAAIAGLTN